MARWHLCNPIGVSERTTEADSEFWAKRRFAPIPKGWFVASDASYRLGFSKSTLPDLCSKCVRHPVTDGLSKCETCRGYHRKQVARAKERKQREENVERTANIQRQRRKREKHVWQENVRQSNIRRGIEQRAAKRQAQLALSL